MVEDASVTFIVELALIERAEPKERGSGKNRPGDGEEGRDDEEGGARAALASHVIEAKSEDGGADNQGGGNADEDFERGDRFVIRLIFLA